MPPKKRKTTARRAQLQVGYRRASRAKKVPPKDPVATRAAMEMARQFLKVYRLMEVRPEAVIEEAQSRGLKVESIEDLNLIPMDKRDALATTFIKTAKIWATSHGASLGAAGVVTMAADVAALVAVNLRLVQHVCFSYGIRPAEEKVDAWGLLMAALGEPVDLGALRALPPAKIRTSSEKLVTEAASLFAKRLIGGRGAGRAVPLVGAVFGGLSNYAYTVEVGTRAREFYRSLAS